MIVISNEMFSETEWRDVYYMFRAMHDNTCPSCGYSHGDFKTDIGGLQCPRCLFELSLTEVSIICDRVPSILKRRIESMKKFQKVTGGA